jgi:putative DNA primase/helicase
LHYTEENFQAIQEIYNEGQKRHGPEDQEIFKLTELGNAQRLVSRHGQNLRFCHEWGKWLIWSGKHWEIDITGEIERRAKDTVRSMYEEAAKMDDEERRAALAKFAARCETSHALTAMIDLAKSEAGIPIISDKFDSNIWLLNCINGTLDLRTGEIKNHRRKDYITKIVPVGYDPLADHVEWIKFLKRILPQSLIEFIQRAIGYSLTGSTREQCLFMPYGTGANGKSTFLEIIAELLDGYAQRTPSDTLMMKDASGVPNDIARLKGARFVVASEIEEGKRLAESLVKQMTGSEKMTARFMRAEFFEFTPQFKLWIGTNHKPVIRGTDNAIWRRIKLIPFNVTIPPEERDKDLPAKLRTELSGILNWAVMGCKAWQKSGLGDPEEVTKATESYQVEMDVISRFIGECCFIDTNLSTRSQSLYNAYTNWCRQNGEHELSSTKFTSRLIEKGFNKDHTRTGTTWFNIAIIEPEENENTYRKHEGLRVL